MRGPGGPAGLQNRFAAVIRPWRFDSPAFRDFRLQVTGVRYQVGSTEGYSRPSQRSIQGNGCRRNISLAVVP